MSDFGIGPGAGFAAANEENQNRLYQGGFKSAELMLRMQQILHQDAVLQHQTSQQQYEAIHREGEALRTAISRAVEQYPGETFDPNNPRMASLIDMAIHHAATEAASFTNAFGGDGTSNFNDRLNAYVGSIQAVPTKVGEAFTQAMADRVKIETGLKLNIPTLEGTAKGQEALATAQSGGAAAQGMNRAAQEEVTPKVLGPDQALVAPPRGSLTSAPPSAVTPGQTAVALPGSLAPPAGTPAIPGVSGAAAAPSAAPLAAPRPAVTSQPLPAPAAAPGIPQRPGTLVPALMSPAQAAAEKEMGQQFGSEKETNAYKGAQASLQNLYQILASAQKLNEQGGFQNTGAAGDLRNEFARSVNSWAQAFGIQPPFDASKVASWEDLTKNTTLMGMQVINQFFGGAREAQTIVQAGIKAVPGATNTPLGVRMVGAGIEQAIKRGIEEHDYVAKAIDSGRTVAQAMSEFNQQNPPGLYAMRGIANAVPDEFVNALKANPGTVAQFDKRFGPGVGEFVLKGGRDGLGAAGQFPGQL